MLPSRPTDDNTDLWLTHVERRSDGDLRLPRSVRFTNSAHLIVGQFGGVDSHAIGSNETAFIRAVTHVVLWGARKQVVRIATGWIIAAMADMPPWRNWSKVKFIRQAVRFPVTDASIALTVDWSIPSPAAVRRSTKNDVGPKQRQWQFLGTRTLDWRDMRRVNAQAEAASCSEWSWSFGLMSAFPDHLTRRSAEIRAVAQLWDSVLASWSGPNPTRSLRSFVSTFVDAAVQLIGRHAPIMTNTLAKVNA